MVVMFSSGRGDVEGISKIGISHSVVPTLCGPKGLGIAGTGLSCGNIVGGHFLHRQDLEIQEQVSGLVPGLASLQEDRLASMQK